MSHWTPFFLSYCWGGRDWNWVGERRFCCGLWILVGFLRLIWTQSHHTRRKSVKLLLQAFRKLDTPQIVQPSASEFLPGSHWLRTDRVDFGVIGIKTELSSNDLKKYQCKCILFKILGTYLMCFLSWLRAFASFSFFSSYTISTWNWLT